MLWPRLMGVTSRPTELSPLCECSDALEITMADRNALGMIGLLFGAATLFVMMAGGIVVADHLTGKLHIEDGLSAVAQPLNVR
jgi:hypothetical protein